MQSQDLAQPSPAPRPADGRRDFALILILFVAFRVMTLLAFRPGGLVLDYSDYYWYRDVSQLTRQGYWPYVSLWSPYPPLFPLLMIGLWQISILLPPWTFPNLWYTLLLGGALLIFETGNLVLIYAIAHKMYNREWALRSAWFYTALFVPIYTLVGWFDGCPLFFVLLGLYLLLRGRPLWSALVTGVGFMVKLVPLILLPIGAQMSNTPGPPGLAPQGRAAGAGKSQISPARWREPGRANDKSPDPRWHVKIPLVNWSFDIWHLIFYFGIFGLTVLVIGLPFYLLNPRMVWGSLTMNNVREPWETVWALLEGKFSYGIVPLDMRNTAWDPAASTYTSPLPWLWITLAFGAIFLWAYTRPLDWKDPRNLTAFTGFTLILFMLYSKGYSPQWLGWTLAFVALLLPNLRGALYAVVVSLANLVEGNIYFTVLPGEHWLLFVTVGLRTLIWVILAAEFMLVVQPGWLTLPVRLARRWAVIGLAAALVVGSVPAGARFVQAYFDARYRQSPYRATIKTLRAQSQPGAALIFNSFDNTTYDWLYPYLRDNFAFYMLDDYAPPGESVEARTQALLESIAAQRRDWWLFDNNPAAELPSEAAARRWLDDHATLVEARDSDSGRLYHFTIK
jgi:hypothetical protein